MVRVCDTQKATIFPCFIAGIACGRCFYQDQQSRLESFFVLFLSSFRELENLENGFSVRHMRDRRVHIRNHRQ